MNSTNKEIKNLTLSVVMALFASFSATTSSATNTTKALGGDGVIENGHIYSMDLYVHGLHQNPYFDSDTVVSEQAFDRAKQALPMFDDEVIHLFAQKVEEIRNVDSLFAEKILLGAEMYTWSFAPRALMSVYDEESNVVIPE